MGPSALCKNETHSGIGTIVTHATLRGSAWSRCKKLRVFANLEARARLSAGIGVVQDFVPAGIGVVELHGGMRRESRVERHAKGK